MSVLINRNLGMNRGTERVYIDEELLNEFGLTGQNYDREWFADKLVLTLNDSGKYTVSSKKKGDSRVPVIDIQTKKLAELFDENQKLRIAIKTGQIVIEAHHLDGLIESREQRFLQKLKSGQPLKMGSVFHGGGVLSSAFHEGFTRSGVANSVAFAVEIDQRYLKSSMRNNKHLFNDNTVFFNSDVADLKYHQMPICDVLELGIPCVGASVSGRAKNKIDFPEEHEKAGTCFFSALNIIQHTSASIIAIENVPQYLSTASFAVIKSVLGSLGYVLYTNVYRGDDFGSTESRERMVCIAISKGLANEDIMNAIAEQIETYKCEATPLAEVISDLPLDDPSWKAVEYLKAKQVRDLAAGKGFAMNIVDPTAKTVGTIGAGYAKARSTEPRLIHPTNPELSRLFTPEEHARIKGINPQLVDGLSATVAHQVLGNSVCINQFVAISRSIADVLCIAHRRVSKVA